MQEFFDENEEKEEEENEEYLENLRTENEIKKIKLSLEHGADFSKQLQNPDLPPEIEGQFLDYIQQFEDEYAKRKTILVYDLAEQPVCKPVAEIPDDEITAELDKLMETLNKHGISLDCICEVEEREVYRFITEELFKVETNDIRIPGMIHGFIYEEFHPNHEHDIKNRCKEFVSQLLDKEKEWMPDFLSLADEVETKTGKLTKQEMVKKLELFRDAFSGFTTDEFELETVAVNDAKDMGNATYHIRYTGTLDGSHETIEYEGKCEFALKIDHEWWEICGVGVPGLVVSG